MTEKAPSFLKKRIPIWAMLISNIVLIAIFTPLIVQTWVDSRTIPSYYRSPFANQQKMVFCDWWNINAGYTIRNNETVNDRTPFGVKIQFFRPSISSPIIQADQPWESNFINLYCNIMQDEGKYKIWYEAYPAATEESDMDCHICYAESLDGYNWTKPILNLVSFNGSTENNIVFAPSMHPLGLGLHGATVFKDPNGKAAERYKMVFLSKFSVASEAMVCGATSPDGLTWTLITIPIVHEHADTQTVVAWDEERACYVGYFRHWEQDRRHISYAETADFRSWPQPKVILGAEGWLDPSTDYYTNGYLKWPGSSGAHLLFPTMYSRGNDSNPGDQMYPQFAISRNGLDWTFPYPEPYIPLGGVGSGMEGMVHVGAGIIELPSKQWALLLGCTPKSHNRPYLNNYSNTLRLATIRQDGFAAICAENQGEFWTIPFKISGSQLLINALTNQTGAINVEICDASTHKSLSGFSLSECKPIVGDQLWTAMQWNSNDDLSALNGKNVELHIHITQGQIYAFKFA